MNKLFCLSLLFLSFIAAPLQAENHAAEETPVLTKGQIIAENYLVVRKLIEITPEGYRVQNFYKHTQIKQSDPFLIKEQKNLNHFQSLDPESMQNLNFEGTLTLHYRNGNKLADYFIKDGKAEGMATSWHEEGTKQVEGHYQQGKPNGLWTYWDKNQNIDKKRYYYQGKVQWEKSMINLKGI